MNGNKKFTTETYSKQLAEINSNFLVMAEYMGVSTPISHKCKTCKNIVSKQPRMVLKGTGCRLCGHKRSREEVETLIANSNPTWTLIGEYLGSDIRTEFQHDCGFITKTCPDAITSGRRKCRKCFPPKYKDTWAKPITTKNGVFQSKLEATVGDWLYTHFPSDDVDRYKNYDLDTLRNCDFYIKSLDLWVEVSSINKPWYHERIYKKRQLVKNFIFASDVNQMEYLLNWVRIHSED